VGEKVDLIRAHIDEKVRYLRRAIVVVLRAQNLKRFLGAALAFVHRGLPLDV
jgi:hypothetical protein